MKDCCPPERAKQRHHGDGEERFRRRAFQRARDQALIVLAMRRLRRMRRLGRSSHRRAA